MIKKISGRVSKMQILGMFMIVAGVALSSAIELELISSKWASWAVSVFGAIVMVLRQFTSEPMLSKVASDLKKQVKNTPLLLVLLCASSCATFKVDCKDKKIIFDVYEKRVSVKCEGDGDPRVTASTDGGSVVVNDATRAP